MKNVIFHFVLRPFSFVLAAAFAAAAQPASAAWTVTSGLNAETSRVGDNFTATDGTWDLAFRRNGNGTYSCWRNSGTGGATLDLTTFNDDMAAAGVAWGTYPVTVTIINNEGFQNLSGLTEVLIPDTVYYLANGCFAGTGLTEATDLLKNITSYGDSIFKNCKSLVRVEFPDSCKEVKSSVFNGCTALEEVKVSPNLTALGGSVFSGCTTLKTVWFDDDAKVAGTFSIPAGVKTISGNTFYNCSSVVRIEAPGATSCSGQDAFRNCTSLEEVDLPEMTGTFGTYALSACKALVRVNVPKCTGTNTGTFQGDTALEEICVSPAFKTLGSDTFRDCTSFRTLCTNEETKVAGHVQLPATTTGTIGNYTFQNTKIERIDAPGITGLGGQRAFEGCTLLEEAHFPSLATASGTYAFYNCPLLRTIEIGPSLSGTLGDCFAQNCTSLETIYQSGTAPVVGLADIPEGVTKTGWGAFMNCKAIEYFVAPGLVDVGNRCFSGCLLLETVRLSPKLAYLRTNNTSWTESSFYNCPKLMDFYPSAITELTFFSTGTFNGCTSLTNFFDFSGCTLVNPANYTTAALFNNCKSLAGVKLPAGFCRFGNTAFSAMRPGAEIHFTGDIPTTYDNGNNALWQGSDAAGNRYKIFVDAETYPKWTNGTFSASNANYGFEPLTDAMKAESDYPGIATIGKLKLHSQNKYNWLVQEPFYVDVTFCDDDGSTVFGVEKTLLGASPEWTGETPVKASSAQFDYAFAGWATSAGGAVIDLAALKADAPMSLYAVYTSSLRSHAIAWQWNDGAATQTDETTVLYGDTPAHAAVERAATETHTYTFLGWSVDGETVLASLPSVTGAATYIAVFEEKDAASTVTVRWLDDDGATVLGTTWPDKGAAAVAPIVPAKESTVSTTYAFAGWSLDGATVLADLTVAADTDFIAVYTPSVRKYTISFVDWDGTVVLSSKYDYGTEASTIFVPSGLARAATDEYNYEFAGWSPAIADVAGDATYIAVYTQTPRTYNATFVDWDGTVLSGPTATAYGAAVAAPADPGREGHTFAGWTPEVGSMPAADTTYTATYTKNKYTITFVNGDGTTTAKYDYGTEAGGIAFPTGSKTSTSKIYYKFVAWDPTPEAVQSNTTYTARFVATIGRPMTLALENVEGGDGAAEFSVSARLANMFVSSGTEVSATAAAITSAGRETANTVEGSAAVSGASVSAVFGELVANRGYDWTITAASPIDEYDTEDVAVLRGRSYAKKHVEWFGEENVEWTGGEWTPDKASESRQQVRVKSAITFPADVPRVHADASGYATGIEIYSANAGSGIFYYGWNGTEWIKLVGAAPTPGVPVEILTAVDFATTVPTVSWYVDGLQLTTEDGTWAIPLAGGDGLSSFKFDSPASGSVSSISADHDHGSDGLILFLR